MRPPNKAVFVLYKIKVLDIRKEVCYCIRVHILLQLPDKEAYDEERKNDARN